MSRIYFHTPTETVEVLGAERAHFRLLCVRIANGVFDMLSTERKLALLPRDWQPSDKDEFGLIPRVDHQFGLLLSSSEGRFTDGEEVFTTVLNTVLRVGSDALALAARIHAQCELHGYVESEDGEFIAGLIEQGLGIGIFREAVRGRPSGWRDVCRVLRAGEIVVSSDSACFGFPNQHIAVVGGTYEIPICDACGGSGEPNGRMRFTDVDYDYCTTCYGEGNLLESAWDKVPGSEQWELAVEGLRNLHGRCWARETWETFYFGSGRSAFGYH